MLGKTMEIPMTEEGLLKLPYKDLQKMARKWSINAKAKKVNIVKALLSSSACTNLESDSSTLAEEKENNINEAIENFAQVSKITNILENNKEEKGTGISVKDIGKTDENVPQKSRRGRRHLSKAVFLEDSECVTGPSPVIIKYKPLHEISNSHITEEPANNSKGNAKKSSKRKRGDISPIGKEVEHNCETDLLSNKCSSIISVEDHGSKKNNAKRATARKQISLEENIESTGVAVDSSISQEKNVNSNVKKTGRQKGLKLSCHSRTLDKNITLDSSITDDKKSTTNFDVSESKNCISRLNSEQMLPQTTSEAQVIDKKSASIIKSESTNQISNCNVLDETFTKNTEEKNTMPVPAPTLIRSSTFTLDDGGNETVPRPPTNIGKSIGKRIMAASAKRGAVISSTKKSETSNGLGVKKTILKNSTTKNWSVSKKISSNLETSIVGPSVKEKTNSVTKITVSKNISTPGSAYRSKFGVARKMPNFRSIHQKLFSNMESIEANHKRALERGNSLIMSPAPRCAVLRKSLENEVADKRTPELRISPNQGKKPAFTIGSAQKPLPSTARKQPVNRFGFKNRINKIEKIVGQKQPPITVEKKKGQERNLIHGVRMNKRFMLQMEMRKNN